MSEVPQEPDRPGTPRRNVLPGAFSLSLRHLQLSDQISDALLSTGLKSIGDVLAFVRSPEYSAFRYRPELSAALSALSVATVDNETDWVQYWDLMGGLFHQLAADLPALRRLSRSARLQPVNRDTFGNAGAMLERAGFSNLGTLSDGLLAGLPGVRGMGRNKLQELFSRLIEISEMMDGEGHVRLPGAPDQTDACERHPDPILPLSLGRLPIGILHLGVKSRVLREEGIVTLGQLIDAYPLGQGRGVGPTTLQLLDERLSALRSATSETGDVDWEAYCSACDIPLMPSAVRPSTGKQFIESLPEALLEIATHLPDEVYAEILRSRLSKTPASQKTLEEIAQSTRPPVTRERVRQKEQKLLRQLAGGLMWDSYGGLGIHFRPSFTSWWRSAAAQFRDKEDIGFDEFVSTLADVWQVDIPSLTEQLPIILAIVTGEPQMPSGFRTAIRINPAFYGGLPDDVKDLSVSRLRLGKYANQLEAQGLSTLGALVESCRSGRIAEMETSATRAARAHLEVLGQCLTSEGNISWTAYRTSLELETIPGSPVRDARMFLESLPSVVEDLLRRCAITGRSAEIYRMRTSQPEQNRLTLEKTALQLNSHGPSIKREETVFLQRLNDILIGKDYTDLPVWLDAAWLQYWSEANKLFETCSDNFSNFRDRLLSLWTVPEADRAVATLWAVLSGYPNGRPARVSKANELPAHDPVAPMARIRLRGFRQVH